jgi:hypothetical protein
MSCRPPRTGRDRWELSERRTAGRHTCGLAARLQTPNTGAVRLPRRPRGPYSSCAPSRTLHGAAQSLSLSLHGSAQGARCVNQVRRHARELISLTKPDAYVSWSTRRARISSSIDGVAAPHGRMIGRSIHRYCRRRRQAREVACTRWSPFTREVMQVHTLADGERPAMIIIWRAHLL